MCLCSFFEVIYCVLRDLLRFEGTRAEGRRFLGKCVAANIVKCHNTPMPIYAIYLQISHLFSLEHLKSEINVYAAIALR